MIEVTEMTEFVYDYVIDYFPPEFHHAEVEVYVSFS